MEHVLVEKRIEKRKNKWVVLDSSGKKVLGTHATKKEALAQLGAVEASKARRMKSYFGGDLND